MTNARIERLASTARPWLTDGGLETSIIFHDGIDLPYFASIALFDTHAGVEALDRYFARYIGLAREAETGFVLDTATWRAGAYWSGTLGRDLDTLENMNRAAVAWALALRDRTETETTPVVVNGVIGPAGDGYAPDRLYSARTGEAAHAPQARWLARSGAEMISAVTMTHTGEAIGIVRAAQDAGLPVVVSFTVETDGRLPTGQGIDEAIAETDFETGAAPLYYMVNCAHPDHFSHHLAGDWTARIGGVRANASRMSHAELDAATELDEGNPEEFGRLYGAFGLPALRVIGGCCGSDDRHVGCAARHVLAAA